MDVNIVVEAVVLWKCFLSLSVYNVYGMEFMLFGGEILEKETYRNQMNFKQEYPKRFFHKFPTSCCLIQTLEDSLYQSLSVLRCSAAMVLHVVMVHCIIV